MVVQELFKQIVELLNLNQIEDASFIARQLFCFALQIPKQRWILEQERKIDLQENKQLEKYSQEIIEGKPLQYITNHQEFMKLDFYVDERVLIPQPDTEILVESVLELAKEKCNILDLCTGSGAIGISLAHELEQSKIDGSDISQDALEVARKNDKIIGTNVTFFQSNIFESIPVKQYDMIVSNPPYIATSVITNLSKQVQQEPRIALDGGNDGLIIYRRILKEAYLYIKQGGYLCLEIGYDQKEAIMQLIENIKEYENIMVKKDLAGNDRCVIMKRR